MKTVGVLSTRMDADAIAEVECLSSTAAVAEPLPVRTSEIVVSPPARVLIQPERSPLPPRVRVRRLAFLDGLRAIGAQVIVWHHLMFYGPLSDVAYPLMPTMIEFLFAYGSMAVQVFLVIGGFVAAQGFSRTVPMNATELTRQIGKRYWRLAWPYLAVIGIAVIANAIAAQWMTHESIAAPATVPQVLAHAFFLQTLLGYESLSAGVWYLAIDFQLSVFTLIVVTMVSTIATRFGRAHQTVSWSTAVLFPLACLALFRWNREPEHDIWAGYYFGSYFLGMTTAWWLKGKLSRLWYGLYLSIVVAALMFDFRERLTVALAATVVIAVAGVTGGLERWLRSAFMEYLARISYSLFLIHFPVCLVINALLSEVTVDRPWWAVAGMVFAWVVSCFAAVALYHGVEKGDWWSPVAHRRSGALVHT